MNRGLGQVWDISQVSRLVIIVNINKYKQSVYDWLLPRAEGPVSGSAVPHICGSRRIGREGWRCELKCTVGRGLPADKWFPGDTFAGLCLVTVAQNLNPKLKMIALVWTILEEAASDASSTPGSGGGTRGVPSHDDYGTRSRMGCLVETLSQPLSETQIYPEGYDLSDASSTSTFTNFNLLPYFYFTISSVGAANSSFGFAKPKSNNNNNSVLTMAKYYPP